MKLLFNVIGYLRFSKLNTRPHGLDVILLVKPKSVFFACIFVPCFLQFPLVAFGQDREDILNSGLMGAKSSSHVTHVKLSDPFRVGYLALERGFKCNDMLTDSLSEVSFLKKTVDSNNSKKRKNNTDAPRGIFGEDISQFLTPEWFIIFLSWVALIFYPLFEKD